MLSNCRGFACEVLRVPPLSVSPPLPLQKTQDLRKNSGRNKPRAPKTNEETNHGLQSFGLLVQRQRRAEGGGQMPANDKTPKTGCRKRACTTSHFVCQARQLVLKKLLFLTKFGQENTKSFQATCNSIRPSSPQQSAHGMCHQMVRNLLRGGAVE